MFKASDVVRYLNEIIDEVGDYDVVIVIDKDSKGVSVSPLTTIGYTLEGEMLTLTAYTTELSGGAAPLAKGIATISDLN